MKERHEMPEFVNWLDTKSYSQAEERVAETTWRAALDMVLTQETDLQHTELGAAIKRELGIEQ